MRYWWVNQNQTNIVEVTGGFLWSPKVNANGRRNQFYDYMKEVLPGDLVFSFFDTRISAIGIAISQAQSAPKPDFGDAGANWSKEGWLVNVEFKKLNYRVRPKDHIALLAPHLPIKYSPLQKNGNGLQSVYLANVPSALANALIEIIGEEFYSSLAELQGEIQPVALSEAAEIAIQGRTDIGPTQIEQLVKSRRGQGRFRANVRLNELGCRVTGVTDPARLRASHIKPWVKSDDTEKLHGCNGLLLSPHIDHLFDQGMISFLDNGDLMISDCLDRTVLQRWGIPEVLNVKPFNKEQSEFLAYHRNSVFKKSN
jgi:putative restriction endonuclease